MLITKAHEKCFARTKCGTQIFIENVFTGATPVKGWFYPYNPDKMPGIHEWSADGEYARCKEEYRIVEVYDRRNKTE